MPKIEVTTRQKEIEEEARALLEDSVLAVFEHPDDAVEEQLFAVQVLADDYSVKTGLPVFAHELERYLMAPNRYPRRVVLGTTLLSIAKRAPADYVRGLVGAAAEHGPRMRAAPVEHNSGEWS